MVICHLLFFRDVAMCFALLLHCFCFFPYSICTILVICHLLFFRDVAMFLHCYCIVFAFFLQYLHNFGDLSFAFLP